MKIFAPITAIALGASVIAAGPAFALTVTNKTDKAQDVTVDRGAEEPVTKVEAGKSATIECPEGCELRAVGINSYGISAEPQDKIVISQDGLMYESQMTTADAGEKSGDKSKPKTMAD
jgi:hypothetical protein